MKLTEENKKRIDGMSMYELLNGIRFAAIGDPWFQGETGDYWMKKYSEMRDKDPEEHVIISKTLGWNKSR
jgi:hypothetical protein